MHLSIHKIEKFDVKATDLNETNIL